MPLTDLYWNDGDDNLEGGPSTLLIAPSSSGKSLVTLSGGTPAPAPTNTLVAVLDGGTGYLGFSQAAGFGSLTPQTFGALTFVNLLWDGVTTNTLQLSANAVVAQNAFTSITVNGVTLLTSAATFSTPFGSSLWQWPSEPFTVPGTYGVTFQ